MHDISLLQDDLRYYRSIAAPAGLYTLQYGECEALPLGEVIRFGQAAGLCVTRALALALKSEWQRSLACALGVGAESAPLAEYVRIHPDKAREHGAMLAPGRDATPSISELYGMFRESGLLEGSPLAEQEAFHELVGICLARGLFLYPADSPKLIEFACSREGAKAALGEESGADAERYRIIHATWRELEDELATLLLRLETQTLKNERINQRWLETFGHLYIPLAESERLHSDLLALVEHVRNNPGLSGEELEELEKELLNIHTEAGRSRKREAPLPRGSESGGGGPGGMPWSAAEMEAYDEECKALLRRIWQFTHPDRIGREGFTEAQRRRLVDCYQEAMAWKEKARLEDDEIFLAKRSTSSLRMILDRVERIWEEMGIDLESTASVRGKTQEERLAWLEARILILDEEIKEVKAEILAVGGDPDSREKMACMVSPERIAAVLAHMEERLAWYQEQIGINEEELAGLLSAGKSGGADA
ncbi:MAG: hypothetical protein ABSG48_05785 [Geobacteraceae bacterium]